jgi:hypothetical protein
VNFTAGSSRRLAADRGFDTLSDTRLGNFINQGRAELDQMFLWPYRLASASGASPLTITDLGTIEEVANSAVTGSPVLAYADRRSLRDSYGDITTTGTPGYFYIDNGVVRTYPVGGTLAVRYYKRPPDALRRRGTRRSRRRTTTCCTWTSRSGGRRRTGSSRQAWTGRFSGSCR